MSEDSEELLLFRTSWRNELEVAKNSKHNEETSKKDTTVNHQDDINDDPINHTRFSTTTNEDISLKDKNRSSQNVKSLYQSKDIVLINLPNPNTHQSIHTSKTAKKQKVDHKNIDENLIEQLISDIDEITVIPFFDLQLPREIGVKIFQFLGIKDLCQCAVVSKAWKNLADDEMLWFDYSVRLSFVHRNALVSEKTDWKGFVHKCITEKRQLQSRWKERICKVDIMEYERGGIFCAVSISSDQICAAYSSGAVLLWDVNKLTYKLLNNEFVTQPGSYPTCSAVNNTICAAGYSNGSISVWHAILSTSPLYHCQLEGPVKSIALSSNTEPVAVSVSDHDMRIDVTDDNGHWFCLKEKNFVTKIQDMKMLSSSYDSIRPSVIITTRDTLYLHGTLPQDDIIIIDHVVGGKMTCLDCNTEIVAVGIGPYGYGVLSNTVRIYRPDSGRLMSVLSGHYFEVTCLNIQDSPPGRLITGSFDRRVRIYDLRSESIVLNLRGHEDYVTTVQMDDWKVVSGAHNGEVCVWDQRTSAVLWRTHARHPVRLCQFDGVHMLAANIPNDRTPQPNLWYADDLILHRRSRGSLRLFDFSSDNVTQGIPGICSSGYDDTSGYNYNIALVTPYDDLNE